ncbi:MAG: YdbH domain-containing protein [Sphingomonadales bacterium]|nr:YdbH domain-containing protein [Sphingomonadales bacterium]
MSALALLAGVAIVAGGVVWWQRESIARRIIAGQLSDLGLPATYKVESIGTRHQVLTDIVIGDPRHPDMTVEKAIVSITPQLGVPTLDTVTLIRPRIYGTYRNAVLSFGALDKILFRQTATPTGLPDLDLNLVDGRGRIDTDFGVVGVKTEGKGNLRGGFAGIIAATSPRLALGGCVIDQASAFGPIRVVSARPEFKGPLRFTALDCRKQGVSVRKGAVDLAVSTTEKFDRFSGSYDFVTEGLSAASIKAARSSGKGDFTFAKGDVTARYDLAAQQLGGRYGAAGTLGIEGLLRSADHFGRLESEGTVKGSAIRPGEGLDQALASAEASGKGTLIAPVAAQVRAALAREGRAATLSGNYVWRQAGALTSVVVPRASLRGASGNDIVALSRFQFAAGGRGGPRFTGNVMTGGAGLPWIEGRVEAQGNGLTQGRFVLHEYRAGDTRIAMPQFALVQRPGGEVGFAGAAQVSGLLPGGIAQNLALPIDGTWSQRHGLAVWRKCADVRFDRFAISNLSLEKRAVTLCPGPEGAMLRSDARGTRFAAGATALNLSGKLGTTPVRVTSGAVGFAWPGAVDVRNIAASLGPLDQQTSLKIATLTGRLGPVSSGTFAGTEFKLANVPLDILDASGNWHFGGGDLALDGTAFRLEDRQADARFRPLVARDATLSLHSTTFKADAVLREPKSDREIVAASIVHDLDTERGFADLDVPGIVFDRKLQPTTLTTLALGVIANAQGAVKGTGRIDWKGGNITSSGRFHTDKLDFAAAFGPVKGTSGTVVFDDLLALTTPPDQRLRFASINPGIEANDGELSFQLQPDRNLVVNWATWPFLDGELRLKPTHMVLGASEVRHFTLEVAGIEAGRFVERMDLANLSARGLFDGTLPLVFDANGGRIEGGMLTSRAPGGNVSYVGALTYKDMGAITNFAFQALRSIDYRKMQIAMDGQLDGEIVTRVRFDGVTQGATAKRNFLTRQFAHLPIQFNVNVRAPFQKLAATFRSLYDTSALRDPRELGLIGKDGKPAAPAAKTPEPKKSSDIQPSDSRDKP